MKRTLLLAFALIAVGCAEPEPRDLDELVQQGETEQEVLPPEPNPRNMAELVQQGDTYLDRETMRPYSGPVFVLFASEPMSVEISANLKDGQLDGSWEKYVLARTAANLSIDKLNQKGSYKNGDKCGDWILGIAATFKSCRGGTEPSQIDEEKDVVVREVHWSDGSLRSISAFKGDMKHGPSEHYALWDGKLSGRETYRDGNLHGPFEDYFTGNDAVTVRGNYKDGDLHGLFEAYEPWTGRLKQRGYMNRGSRCGEWWVNETVMADGDGKTYFYPLPPCDFELDSN